MSKFIFRGPETNLGVFGLVRSGDLLNMTEREAAGIKGDRRFEPVPEDYQPKPAPIRLPELTNPDDPQERTAVARVKAEEEARRERLAAVNAPEAVQERALREAPMEELRALAQQVHDLDGSYPRLRDMNKAQLIQSLLTRRDVLSRNDTDDA